MFGLPCLAMKIQEILSLCRKPGRYIGREKNAFQKGWDSVQIRTACIFPDLYEIGMSHLGLQILYDIINRLPWALSDRAYCPDTDLEDHLRKHGLSLFGLETRRPLSRFDCLLITLPYELCYSNIFTILDLAGVPVWQKDRISGNWPLVIGGGSCCLNPEPVAPVFDAVVIGDGEEAVVELLEVLKGAGKVLSRQEILQGISSIQGVYVPSFFNPVHRADGRFAGMETRHGGAGRVRRRIMPKLEAWSFPERPLVPNVQVVHDRLGIEIARGCTRGCRYCQASSIYRPVRERSLEDVLALADRGLRETGWEEISLLSLSTGDYSQIAPLIKEFMDSYVRRNISVSLPSLRVGTLTPEIMDQISRVRKTGFTLAPEAGSDRLRQVINKGITEGDLLETVSRISARGWNSVKLYFMIGLPTETDDDVLEIVHLARKVMSAISAFRTHGRPAQVTVSVGTFVPKPHTPFQWEAQISTEESKRRLNIIRDGLKGKRFRVKWHDPMQSFLEGIFSRGDRRLSGLLFRAWKNGARLDAWTDNMKPELYFQAADELGIDLEAFLAPIPEDVPLPWDHIDSGIKKAFLRLERKRSRRLEYTPDCRKGECQGCGTCDFEQIKPVLAETPHTVSSPSQGSKGAEISKDQEPAFFCLLVFSKLFDARFLGHLDMVRMFLRAVRRAGLPVAFSRGFHPMPRVSFSQPLPLGTESLREEAVLALEKRFDPSEVMKVLNRHLPLDIRIESCRRSRKKFRITARKKEAFLLLLRGQPSSRVKQEISAFLRSDRFDLEIEKKGRKICLDLRQRVEGLASMSLEKLEDDRQRSWAEKALSEVSAGENALVRLDLLQEPPPHIKPSLAAGRIFGMSDEETALSRILRL